MGEYPQVGKRVVIMVNQYDIVIVGGGLVGATLAHALVHQGFKIALVEKLQPNQKVTPDYDARSIALSSSSVHVFKQLELWSYLQPKAHPIKNIHVSERGGFAITRLSAQEAGIDALGYVVEAQYINQALWRDLASTPLLTVFAPAQVTALQIDAEQAVLSLSMENKTLAIAADLVIAADGIHSFIREQLHIGVKQRDYHQTALVAHITPTSPNDTAYERFTSTGPLALLPLTGKRYGVVWAVTPTDAARLVELPDADFLAQLQETFGTRLGRFTRVGKRQAFPLMLQQAYEQVRPRAVLIGSASHHLHPVAGQGFNLALRDVALLTATLKRAHTTGEPIGDVSVLTQYLNTRTREQNRVLQTTDGIVRLFSNEKIHIRIIRQLGLLAFDQFGVLKHGIMRHAMGLTTQLDK